MTDLEPDFVNRLWRKDVSLWDALPNQYDTIANRLGWLDADRWMLDNVTEINDWIAEVVQLPWLERILLLGMGGSSMAPEVFASMFPRISGYPFLQVVDTTSPEQIRKAEGDLSRTLVIVSSKSGSTRETDDLCSYFFARMGECVDFPENHFVAITDSGSKLHEKAKHANFRKIFVNPSDIGGRYSALSYFGLIPAGLIGVDIQRLSDRVSAFCQEIKHSGVSASEHLHDAIRLGMVMGNAAVQGHILMTLRMDHVLSPLFVWIEQLIAESTGKMERGIVPVFEENDSTAKLPESLTRRDGMSIHMGMRKSQKWNISCSLKDVTASDIVACPELETDLQWSVDDVYDLGVEFFRWEVATVVASSCLGINPFDEPNVSEAKASTGLFIEGQKKLEQKPHYRDSFHDVFYDADFNMPGDATDKTIGALYQNFISTAADDFYIGILAYLPFSEELDLKIKLLGKILCEQSGIPVTLGYGPRYLHSTGQLHKGGPTRCNFLQLVDDSSFDLDIPGRDYTFKELNKAQADGDFSVLESRGRKIMRVVLKGDRLESMDQFLGMIAGE
ncbi:MAG: hypothetical protein GKR95_08935 [Gammaproteobacteria bacterium]|nr:hypothetical protein [Gammaproteobacteria bacterium]